MPTTNGTRSWVRLRLTGRTESSLTEGELILRADRVTTGPEHVIFFVGDAEVFRLERRYHRSMAWFVDRPTFAEWLRERRAEHPSAHKPWPLDEVRRLDDEIGIYAMDWGRIAARHGRTASAVRAKAIRHGLITTRNEA